VIAFSKNQVTKMKTKSAIIFAIVGLLLSSSIALTIDAAAAKPEVMDNLSNRLAQTSWVRINGVIEQLGTTEVRGQLQVVSRTAVHLDTSNSKEATFASAIWTENTSRAIQSVRAKENFTYVFYVARLPNASVSTFTTNEGNYFLDGTWNYAKVTSTTTVNTDENGTITHVHREQDVEPLQAYGELTVADNKFTLKIDGIDELTGSVYRSVTRSWFNPFKMSDDTSTNTVVRSDLKAIGGCYGFMPGWGNFDMNMDFNNNYRVDISDISSVAANM
jgi:hypothetical protein